MKKISFYIINIICIFIMCGCSDSSNYNDELKNIHTYADEKIIEDNLKNISSRIRNYGSKGEIETAEYIKDKLINYGYDVKFQNFNVYKQDLNSTIHTESNIDYLRDNPYKSEILGKGRNIIANNKKFDKRKKTLYLTAHYDTTDHTKGVVDNASGTSAVLELGRILKNFETDFNVSLIFFSAEEHFRSGSKYFVSSLSEEEKNNIIGCINVDMVGEKGVGEITMNSATGKSNSLSIMLDELTESKYKLLIGGGSDELSFYMGEVPSISFWSDYREGEGSSDKSEENLDSIDIGIIKDFCESIGKALVKLDIKSYENLVTEKNIIKSKITDDDKKVISNFKLIDKEEILLGNGYDVETRYVYANENNKIIVKERSSRFIEKSKTKKLIMFHTDNNDGYKIIKTDNTYKVEYKLGYIYGEISDFANEKEAIDFFNIYSEKYSDEKIKS